MLTGCHSGHKRAKSGHTKLAAMLVIGDACCRGSDGNATRRRIPKDFLIFCLAASATNGRRRRRITNIRHRRRRARRACAPAALGAARMSARAAAATGHGVAFCVRLCDGHHFPMEQMVKGTPAETCRSICPYSKTKVFFGAEIGGAVAQDGQRYADLDTAFMYRKQMVEQLHLQRQGRVGPGAAGRARRSDIAARRHGRHQRRHRFLYRPIGTGRDLHAGQSGARFRSIYGSAPPQLSLRAKRCAASGSQPCGASSNVANSKSRRHGAADQRPVAERARRLPGVSGNDALRPFAASEIVAEHDAFAFSAAAISSASGAPACQCQISTASTRCQCERSPRASRK